jgi:hypothetical protein
VRPHIRSRRESYRRRQSRSRSGSASAPLASCLESTIGTGPTLAQSPPAPSLAEYGWVTRSVKPMQSAVITPMKSNPASPDSSTVVEQGQGIISAVRLCSCLRNVRNSAEKHLFCERRASGTAFAKWKIASNVARPSQPGFFVTQTFARRHWNGRPGVEPDALRRDSGKAPPPTRSAVSEPSTRRSYPRPPPEGLRVLKRHSLREC